VPCLENRTNTAPHCRFLPYVGMVTIIMNDYPMLKYGLIAVLGILVITSKE
jgi:signal peptidase